MYLINDLIKEKQNLFLIISELKRKNSCLETDLLRFKLLSNNYQKYLQFLDEINFTLNENNIQLNNEFRDKISKLSLNYSQKCFVCIENINTNQSKGIEIKNFFN